MRQRSISNPAWVKARKALWLDSTVPTPGPDEIVFSSPASKGVNKCQTTVRFGNNRGRSIDPSTGKLLPCNL